jgi:hypothetical protein
MSAATDHAIHIHSAGRHGGPENSAQLYLLQGYQRVNPIPKDEREDAF